MFTFDDDHDARAIAKQIVDAETRLFAKSPNHPLIGYMHIDDQNIRWNLWLKVKGQFLGHNGENAYEIESAEKYLPSLHLKALLVALDEQDA